MKRGRPPGSEENHSPEKKANTGFLYVLAKHYFTGIRIQNLNNTCYMASVLQLLFNYTELKSALDTYDFPPNTLKSELKQLFHDYHTSEADVFYPQKFFDSHT